MKTLIIALVVMLIAYSCTKENISTTIAIQLKTNSVTSQHYIGEHFGGGIIFWLDSTGQHLLQLQQMSLKKRLGGMEATYILKQKILQLVQELKTPKKL